MKDCSKGEFESSIRELRSFVRELTRLAFRFVSFSSAQPAEGAVVHQTVSFSDSEDTENLADSTSSFL